MINKPFAIANLLAIALFTSYNSSAAIVDYSSSTTMDATVAARAGSEYVRDNDNVNTTNQFNYSGSATATASDEYLEYNQPCDCYIPHSAQADSTVLLNLNSDIGSKTFTGSSSYDFSVEAINGDAAASAIAQTQLSFRTTSTYRYDLELFISSGTMSSVVFDGNFQDPSDLIYVSNDDDGTLITQSGLLMPSYPPGSPSGYQNTLHVKIQGNGSVGAPSGNYSYTLNLTEVPVPAAAWLFGSALIGLVGIKRKK